MTKLLDEARSWVNEKYTKNALHLIKAEEWLYRFAPDATEEIALATVTHDMERAFPGPDSPEQDFSVGGVDPEYNRLHSERSALIVSTFLREHGASATLIDQVAALIKVHEDGGWAEADLVQAADSVSFLEVNVELFLEFINTPENGWTPALVREKFAWMFERINIPEARKLAFPFYQNAIQRLDQLVVQPKDAAQA